MGCIICNAPVTNITHKTHLTIKNDKGEAVRSTTPFPLCFDHYATGDYKGLACAVIESAIADLCDEKLIDIAQSGGHKKNAVTARRMDAKGFLFGKGVEFWADVAEIPLHDLKAYIQKRLVEAKQSIIDAKGRAKEV